MGREIALRLINIEWILAMTLMKKGKS